MEKKIKENREDNNPFVLEPNFYGLGIKLRKIIPWIKGKFKKNKTQTISTDATAKDNNLISQTSPVVITESSTSFFHGKFCDAFPGIRNDVIFFTSKKDIIKRLSVLFSKPIHFDDARGYHTVTDPIWWFRGGLSLPIKNFEPLKNGRVLLDIEELKIKKIAACRGNIYYKNFVYIECDADKPTKLYEYKKGEIQKMFEENGCYKEEYALFKNKKITRAEYDDGSAIIKGRPQQVDGAKLRVRYLTKYNFIVTAKFSPYNCRRFDMESEEYFNNLLKEKSSFKDFLMWMNTFEKHRLDD